MHRHHYHCQVFATIGNWLTSVYLILALHAVPVWLFWAFLRIKLRQAAAPHPHLQWLICCPPDLMVLASIGIIAPSLGIFVEVDSSRRLLYRYKQSFY